MLCASPEYLARHGHPRAPADLVRHECLVIRENEGDFAMWRFGEHGEGPVVRVSGRLAVNDGDVATAWALAGVGIVLRSQWQVQPLIAQGRLVHVMPDVPTPAADVSAVYDGDIGLSRRVRVALDHIQAGMAERLGEALGGGAAG